jgi:hypothetical protein
VIGQVANYLNKEVYGDVPSMQQLLGEGIQAYMRNDFSSLKVDNMVVIAATIHVDGPIKINPQFIWKISSKVYELIPKETLSF